MTRESQYIEDYLDTTAVAATRWTPHTYLAYTLSGAARVEWSGRYYRALMAAINRRIEAGTVMPVMSKGGSTAYVRRDVTDALLLFARTDFAIRRDARLTPAESQAAARA